MKYFLLQLILFFIPFVVFAQSNDSLILFKQNKKYGFKNNHNKIIIPCIYDSAFAFNEGVTPVKKNKKWFYIDALGRPIHKDVPDEMQYFDNARPYYNGFAIVTNKYKEYDGSVSTHTRPIGIEGYCDWTDFNADSLGDFVTGYAIIKRFGKYGVLSIGNDEVVDIAYDGIDSFSNGYVKVLHNKKWKTLNPYGECIHNCDSADKTTERNEKDSSTLFFNNFYPEELSENSKQKLEKWAVVLKNNPTQKIVLLGNGNFCYSSQQNSWDCTNTSRTYLVDELHVNPEQIIFNYGGNGKYRTVNIRDAQDGEEGPNNLPPPFPTFSRYLNRK